MFKDDILYTCSTMDQLATYRMNKEMMKYSERFVFMEKFRGLRLDQESRIRDHTRGSVSLEEL